MRASTEDEVGCSAWRMYASWWKRQGQGAGTRAGQIPRDLAAVKLVSCPPGTLHGSHVVAHSARVIACSGGAGRSYARRPSARCPSSEPCAVLRRAIAGVMPR